MRSQPVVGTRIHAWIDDADDDKYGTCLALRSGQHARVIRTVLSYIRPGAAVDRYGCLSSNLVWWRATGPGDPKKRISGLDGIWNRTLISIRNRNAEYHGVHESARLLPSRTRSCSRDHRRTEHTAISSNASTKTRLYLKNLGKQAPRVSRQPSPAHHLGM